MSTPFSGQTKFENARRSFWETDFRHVTPQKAAIAVDAFTSDSAR
jgi:hypothetical protein